MAAEPFRLTKREKGGIATTLVGLVILLLVGLIGVKEGFWVAYTDGFRATGWMLVFVGLVWLAFTVAKDRASFLDMDRRISSDMFGVSVAAIGLIAIVALLVLLPRLPATKESSLPPDPKARAQVIREERNFRYYVSFALILSGLAVGSIPAIRFFRK